MTLIATCCVKSSGHALRAIDVAHPALADALDQPERADDAPWSNAVFVFLARDGVITHRRQEGAGAPVRGEQRFDLLAQSGAARAVRLDHGAAMFVSRGKRRFECGFGFRPCVGHHSCPVEAAEQPCARKFPEPLHGRR